MKKLFLFLFLIFSSFINSYSQCPTASFYVTDYSSTCPPLADTLHDNSINVLVGATYYYDFGDGAYSSLQSPLHIYGFAGTFYPKLIVTNPGGCADTFQLQTPISIGGSIFLLPLLVTPDSGCSPLAVTFQINSNAVSIVLETGDSIFSTSDSIINYVYTNPGTYYPLVLLNDGLCSYSHQIDSVVVLNCTDIKSITAMDFTFYPNPATSSINISSSGLPGAYSLKIYNLLGQQVKHEQHNFSDLENYKINVAELPTGYYQLLLSNNKDSFSRGYVKE